MTRHASRDAGGNRGQGEHWIRTTTRHRIYRRDQHRCVWCDQAPTPTERTLDHVLPRAAGGSNAVTNLVLACFRCNAARKDRAAITFAYDLAYSIDPAPNRRQAAMRAAVILNRLIERVESPLPPRAEPDALDQGSL